MRNLILALFLTVAILGGSTGCTTNQVSTITKTEGVTIASVNTAMQVWHDWVMAGKATQSQLDTVKKAYGVYYDAQQQMKAALELASINSNTNSTASDMTTANAAVANAGQSLINLISTFTK